MLQMNHQAPVPWKSEGTRERYCNYCNAESKNYHVVVSHLDLEQRPQKPETGVVRAEALRAESAEALRVELNGRRRRRIFPSLSMSSRAQSPPSIGQSPDQYLWRNLFLGSPFDSPRPYSRKKNVDWHT